MLGRMLGFMMSEFRYKNKFHTPGKKEYGPEYYSTDAKPHYYKGYRLYNRIPGTVCDIVRDDVCISQCVTVRGAMRHIDKGVYDE